MDRNNNGMIDPDEMEGPAQMMISRLQREDPSIRTDRPIPVAKIKEAFEQMRGGRDNDPRFGSRMRGEGPFADLVRARFRAACRKHGLNAAARDNHGARTRLRTDLFQAPAQPGDQFRLFG